MKDLSVKADFSLAKSLILTNVLLSMLGGLMWYLQFFSTPGSRQHSTAVRLHKLDAAHELLRTVWRTGWAGTEGVE